MKNAAIAKVFKDIADLLELKGENVFKVRAYQRAAHTIENLAGEVEKLAEQDRLRDVTGVGEAIAKKIQELVSTGRLEYYEKLRAGFPEGTSSLLEVPGIGPRTALRLAQELDVKNVDELEAAIKDGRVASLFRMGQKTAENMLHQIQALRRKDQRIPLGEALPIVEQIVSQLGEVPGLRNLVAAGSLRRFQETVGDIDLMGTATDRERAIDAFVSLPLVKEVLVKGSTKASVIVAGGSQVDLRLVDHDSFGSLLQYFTGSKQHNILLSEYGITHIDSGELEKFATEEDFYERLGLQLIPPELRQGAQEIEMAERRAIPRLVEPVDIKGDLHVHTDWSDGHDSIEAMVRAARARGYQYVAITDHSVGRGVAHGLSIERLREQVAEIRRVAESVPGIRIFVGSEVDIRADASLDLPDQVLEELDIVVAAVHSAMGQDEARMTQRIVKALQNRHVDILAHPTCRLLGEREPVNVDMEAVFRAALATDTALEINAMPPRLDLKDTHVFRARQLGVKLVISTDAHAPDHLELVRFGVGVARRGWCQAKDILNTRPVADIEAFLRRAATGHELGAGAG